jgi:hypothetical protein
MATILYSNEFKIPHERMLELSRTGKLRLGINNSLTIEIATNKYLKPQKTTASAALLFWSWVGILIFAYSIYLSITSNWWYFILGFIAWRILWKANKRGNTENLLDAALVDKEFYEKVLKLNGWSYLTEAEFVKELKQSSLEVKNLSEKILSSRDDELDLCIYEDLLNKSGFTVRKSDSIYEIETDEAILESETSELIRIARFIASRIAMNKFVSSGFEFWEK